MALGVFNLLAAGKNILGLIPHHSHTFYLKHQTKYGSTSKSPSEHNYRMKLFHRNLQEVKALRKRHPEAQFVLNKFSHLSFEEKAATLTGSRILSEKEAGPLVFGRKLTQTEKIQTIYERLL